MNDTLKGFFEQLDELMKILNENGMASLTENKLFVEFDGMMKMMR